MSEETKYFNESEMKDIILQSYPDVKAEDLVGSAIHRYADRLEYVYSSENQNWHKYNPNNAKDIIGEWNERETITEKITDVEQRVDDIEGQVSDMESKVSDLEDNISKERSQGGNIDRDIKAKPRGWRFSGENNYKRPNASERGTTGTYFEARRNRSDKDLRKKLGEGGDVKHEHKDMYAVTIVWMNDMGTPVKYTKDIEADTKEEAIKLGKEALKKTQTGNPEDSHYDMLVGWAHQLGYYLNADAVIIPDDVYIVDFNEKSKEYDIVVETRDGKSEGYNYYDEDNELDFHGSVNYYNAYYLNEDESRKLDVQMYSESGNPDNPNPDINNVELLVKVGEDYVPVEEETGNYHYGVYHYGRTLAFEFLSDNPDLVQTEPSGRYEDVIKKMENTEKFYRGGKYDRGTRPSPRESATLYRVGERRYGQDGNLWEIVQDIRGIHRWKKVNRYAKGGEVTHTLKSYEDILGKAYSENRKITTSFGDAVDNSFRDLGLATNGKIDKSILDKFLSNRDAWKKIWIPFKKDFEIYVKDGYYINPYQYEVEAENVAYAKGGEVSPFSVGDILKYKDAISYWTINTDNEKGGHYTYRSDRDGNGLTPEGSNWIMFLWHWEWDKYVKVGHKELEKVTKHGISFYKSGNKHIDIKMSLVEPDGRYKFFRENAPKNLKQKFDYLENFNWHYASAELVNDFFNHPTWVRLKNHHLAAEEGGIYEQGGIIEKLNTTYSFSDLFR